MSTTIMYKDRQTDRQTERNRTKQNRTSVSETIRKPPLVKAQTALRKQNKIKYGEERFSIWRMEFLHPAMWHDHDIYFARWLHPAMWHVALGSWQWIHQVAVGLPCNVTRGSGMTCHWIHQVAAPCNVTHGSGITWHWVCLVAAPCSVIGGSGMTYNRASAYDTPLDGATVKVVITTVNKT